MATYTCRICGCVDPSGHYLSQGRCQMCAVYWKRHGMEPPFLPPERPAAPRVRLCTHCGQPAAILRRGRCPACYSYWYRTGRERPTELWAR